jgi:hypothetical protein
MVVDLSRAGPVVDLNVIVECHSGAERPCRQPVTRIVTTETEDQTPPANDRRRLRVTIFVLRRFYVSATGAALQTCEHVRAQIASLGLC